jgi:RNA polymerase sigma factor (sigma-70 family)
LDQEGNKAYLSQVQLVAAIRAAGDAVPDHLVDQLLECLDRPVAYCSRRFGLDYDDLLQEVMLKLCKNQWEALNSWKGQASLETWLRVITSNTCLNLVQRGRFKLARNASSLDFDITDRRDDLGELEKALDLRIEVSKLMEVSRRLPQEQAYVLIERYYHGRSSDDLSSELNKTTNHINVISHRAVAALRQLLGVQSDA